MEFLADLHVHSTASDGMLTPEQVVAAAGRQQLKAVALTDHDTLEGLVPAQAAGRALGIEVIGGVELSTEWAHEEVHVLGYFLSPGDGDLARVLARLRRARVERAQEMVKRLARLGLHLSWEEVQAQAETEAVGRPHIARALVRAGHVPSVKVAFERYLNRGCPAYVPRMKLTPAEAIALVQRNGGVAVLAHPGLLSRPEVLEELLPLDWQGIEVFYPEHSEQVTAALLTIARERGLVPTGGSDFHGEGHAGPSLGACAVSTRLLLELKRRRRF